LVRYIGLLVANGAYERAIELLRTTQFVISEGGGSELGDAYVDAHLLHGMELLNLGRAEAAFERFAAAAQYPANLSQESPRNRRKTAAVEYCTAMAERALGRESEARARLEKLIEGFPGASREARFYRALALAEVGRGEEARGVGQALIDWAEERLGAEGETDFFAKFGEQQTAQGQLAEAHYIFGLGALLLDRNEEARKHLEQALTYEKAHVWATYRLAGHSGHSGVAKPTF
jgi:hypothetical protein